MQAKTCNELEEGAAVEYYQRDGLVGVGVICGSGEKNGQTVYVVDMPNGDTYWGYRDQFKIANKNTN